MEFRENQLILITIKSRSKVKVTLNDLENTTTLKGHRVIYRWKGNFLLNPLIPNLCKSNHGLMNYSLFSVSGSLTHPQTVKYSKCSRSMANGPIEVKIGILPYLKVTNKYTKFHQNRRGTCKKLSGVAWNDPSVTAGNIVDRRLVACPYCYAHSDGSAYR